MTWPRVSRTKVGTQEFAHAVIDHLGHEPRRLAPVHYAAAQIADAPVEHASYVRRAPAKKQLVGIDVFIDWAGSDPNEIGTKLASAGTANMPLSMITNRGIKVWPNGLPETFCTDHWRCRFQAADGTSVSPEDVIALLARVHSLGLDFIKTEHLYTFDGEPGFSLGQGQ